MLGLVAGGMSVRRPDRRPSSMQPPEVSPGTGKFDAFRLVRDKGVLSGQLDAATLPRVADQLIEDAAPVAWRIEGTTDPLGRPALSIAVDGMLPLECQRCLEVERCPIFCSRIEPFE